MPVNITGAKYNARFLASVGTTSLTVTQTVFVSTDFGATQRMVSLHSSTGAFKGIAWVRQWISGTQLQLENQFVDPATGLYATQVVGDQVFVSKNAVESATTGFAVDSVAMTITVTDNILMGTAGVQNSVCFYDQNYQFIITNGHTFNGGVSVYGKLISYDGTGLDSLVWSRECNVRPRTNYNASGGTPAYNFWGTGGTSAHMFFFGGAIGNSLRDSYFIGAQTTNATNGSFAFYGTRLYYACASPSNGGNWSANATRHLLYKTIHEADYTNANLIVWGNGAFKGQYLSFPQFGAGNPIGVFRAAGAVTFGADANNRTVVADVGNGAFIDDANNGSYTFINTITPAVSILRFAGGTVPIIFQFSDSYTNLKTRSTLVMQRGDGTVLNSVVNTANTIYTPIVTQAIYSATANGVATATNFYLTFNYTVKCYGYDVVSGSHTPYTYSLGTAGNGTDLKIGGLINQLVDTNVTLSETNALLLSSKFSINSTTKVITVTANATYDELYDYVIAWNCSSQANALIPNLSEYLITANGTDLTAFATWALTVNTGVTLSGGAKFTKVRFDTITLNGTGAITSIYQTSVGTSTVLELNTPSDNYSLAVWKADGSTKYFGSNLSTGQVKVYFTPAEAGTYYFAAEKYGVKRQSETLVLNGGVVWYNATDQEDVGITEATLATVQAYTTITNSEQFFDYTAVYRLSETGIKKGNIVSRDGTNINITGFNHVIKNDASSIYSITGDTIITKGASYEGTTKYEKEVTDFSHTIEADTTEIITILIEDANGDSSALLAGTVNNLIEVWKITNETLPKDFATGTLIDTGIGNGLYRFIHEDGFQLVFNNTDLGIVFRYCSMSKGDYQLGWYIYNIPTGGLTDEQADRLNDIYDKEVIIQNKLDTDLDVKVSTRLAAADYVEPATAQDVWEYTTRTLTSAGAAGATLEEIEGSTILAKKAQIDSVETKVDALPTLSEIEATTILFKAADYVAPDNTKIAEIKTKVDTLNNTDLTGVEADLVKINLNVKDASLFIPATRDL